jgi:hypothetical protein
LSAFHILLKKGCAECVAKIGGSRVDKYSVKCKDRLEKFRGKQSLDRPRKWENNVKCIPG